MNRIDSDADHVAIDVFEVERIAALGWRGLDEAGLGSWPLRAAGGFTGRSNSALVLGDPPAGDWIGELQRWYAERGLPPMAQIPMPGAEPIDTALAEAGWRARDLVQFLTGDIRMVRDLSPSGRLDDMVLDDTVLDVTVRLENEPDDAWLAGYQYRGDDLPPLARRVLCQSAGQAQLCFASVRDPAAPESVLAVARGALAEGWLGITAVTVGSAHRRMGLGTRLMSELARWGADRGGRAIYLQVAADNAPALTLYAGLGFYHHHDYRYRVGPSD